MMKKLFLFLFVVACGLVSCEGPMGPEGPEGPGMKWNVEFVEIKTNQWVRGEDDYGVFYRAVYEPEYLQTIQQKDRDWIYDNGTMMAYMFENFGASNETQHPLPNVLNWHNNQFTQVQNFYFDYTPNDIAFYYRYSGNEGDIYPLDVTFRIVMNW